MIERLTNRNESGIAYTKIPGPTAGDRPIKTQGKDR
jgi:hypothetical protein